MPPGRSQPLHRPPVRQVERDLLQAVEHVVQAHGPQPVEQATRIVQHDPGLPAFVHQLRDELGHAFVAPMEHRRVVVVADPLVVHHVLEVTDDSRRPQVRAARGNQRLVHVKRDAEGAPHASEVDARFGQIDGAGAIRGFCNRLFRSADVWQPPYIFRQHPVTLYLLLSPRKTRGLTNVSQGARLPRQTLCKCAAAWTHPSVPWFFTPAGPSPCRRGSRRAPWARMPPPHIA